MSKICNERMNNKRQAYCSNVVLHLASLRCLWTAVFLLQVGVMTFERRCQTTCESERTQDTFVL